MDYTFWVPLAATGLNLYLTYRQVRFIEAQVGATPLPKLTTAIRIGRYWPIASMFVLMLACWIPYFLIQEQRPQIQFLNWGAGAGIIFATVKTDSLAGKRPDRLIMIARVADASVPYETDKQTARSSTFEIGDQSTTIQINLSAEDLSRLNKPGAIQVYVLEVASDFPFENVRSVGEAQKLGAKIVGITGVGGFTAPSQQR
jgi:tRNA threonylcarbamoyladenosine modification (KEOPS) complex  Pcc1 subunit